MSLCLGVVATMAVDWVKCPVALHWMAISWSISSHYTSVRVFYRCAHLEKLEEIHLVTLACLWQEFEFIPEVCYTKNGTRGEVADVYTYPKFMRYT